MDATKTGEIRATPEATKLPTVDNKVPQVDYFRTTDMQVAADGVLKGGSIKCLGPCRHIKARQSHWSTREGIAKRFYPRPNVALHTSDRENLGF